MTVLWGDTGKVITGPLKTFTFQTATPREVSLGNITLPNAEGTTNQISFTVQQSDLPTITPNPVSMKYAVNIIASGKCVTAANVSFRIFKNGVSLATTNTTGTANQFWSQNHWRWYDVAVGDVLEVRIWSNQIDTTLDYSGIMIVPTNVVLSKPNTILKDLTYTIGTTANQPNISGAGVRSAVVGNNQSVLIMVANVSNAGLGNTNGGLSVTVSSGNILTFPYIFSAPLGVIRALVGGDGGATKHSLSVMQQL
jgi:hypothetical protein